MKFLRLTLFLATLAGFAPLAPAQAPPSNPPKSLGPLGGSASSLATDPLNPNVVLVIKYTKGLFRSTDGGKTFDKFGTGIPNDIRDLRPDPSNPGGLYVLAGNQILKSTDFGASWSPLPFSSIENLKGLSIAPNGTDLMASDAFNVYRSTTGGTNWAVTFAVVPYAGEVIEDVIHAPSNPAIVYCTTNKGVYKSTHGGASFTDPGPFSLWAQAITVSPNNANVVFVGTPFNGVHKSTDGAATFAPVGTGLAATGNGEFFVWSPNGSELWYTVLTGVTKTADLGATWTDEGAGLASNTPIPLCMAYDALGNLFLGTEGGGLNDQSGGGLYWRPVGATQWEHIGFLEVHINDVAVAGPGGMRVVGLGGGVYAANPGEVLVPTAYHWDIGADTRTIAVDPSNPDRWVSGGVGAFLDNAQIVVVTQGGSQYVKTYEKSGAGYASEIVFDPHVSGRVLAGLYPGGFGARAILASVNSGASWTEVAGTEGWATRSIAFDPFVPGHVLELSENNQWSSSVNGGFTWAPLQPAWPASGPGVFLAFDPFLPNLLYRGDAGSGLWRSANGGTSWTSLGLPLHNESSLVLSSDVPGLLWVSDANGKISMSTDRGATFTTLWDVHLAANGTSMALDRASGSLLVGTDSASLWEVPGASPVVAYGTGTPGCQGTETLTVNECPKVGAGSFAIATSVAPPSSLGLGLVTDQANAAGSDPFGIGVLLHVDLLLSTEVIPLDFVSDGAGQATAPAPIPNTPALANRTYYAQTIWGWPVSSCSLPPFNLSSSRGLALTILP